MTIETIHGSSSERPKLAVMDAAVRSYAHLFHHVWIYLGQLALWVGIVFSVALAFRLAYVGSYERDIPEALAAAVVLIGGLIALVGLMSVCVGCHRAILLDEKPRLFGMFRVRGRELRYAGLWFICMIVFVSPVIGIAVISAEYARNALPLVLIVVLGWAAVIAPLFALAFPAVAVDSRRALRSGIRLSRGHRLRLLGLLIAVHVPLVLAAAAFGVIGAAIGPIVDLVSSMVELIQTLVLVAATSVAYKKIAGPTAEDVAAVFD